MPTSSNEWEIFTVLCFVFLLFAISLAAYYKHNPFLVAAIIPTIGIICFYILQAVDHPALNNRDYSLALFRPQLVTLIVLLGLYLLNGHLNSIILRMGTWIHQRSKALFRLS